MTYCGITLGEHEECLDNLHRRVPVHHMLPEMAAYTRNEREDFQAGHPTRRAWDTSQSQDHRIPIHLGICPHECGPNCVRLRVSGIKWANGILYLIDLLVNNCEPLHVWTLHCICGLRVHCILSQHRTALTHCITSGSVCGDSAGIDTE
jgi:hypothetical protein